MNIFGRLFSWLGQLFRSDRADLIATQLAYESTQKDHHP